MFSGKQLQKLGKRLRLDNDPADLAMLNDYRRWFDPTLLDAAFSINTALGGAGPAYLLSGRAKRTKSILRKLVREPTMDLSRMTDIVGLRFIVDGAEEQRRIVDRLKDIVPVEKTADYTGRDHLYRAVHLQGLMDGRKFELQVRTLPQQLWADESEAFGEQAKEGKLTTEQRIYLEELRNAVSAIDNGEPDFVMSSPLANARRPCEIGLRGLREGFAAAARPHGGGHDRTLLVVHDEALNQLMRQSIFGTEDRQNALAEYERLMNTLEQTRFSVLLLNARNLESIKVTHPRFFRGA